MLTLACARGVQRLVPSQMQDLRVFRLAPQGRGCTEKSLHRKSSLLNKHELQLDVEFVESMCF